ncbi:E3 ubiquitin-protein ligase APD2-like isoform X2 [Lotus japonicus]|uniref:E3 ubiquitin-protein ligase APD2-like isoform X2 n=1 Tax=Lotus japonicus TaxID=34305 RepID=UPI00258DA7EB|nr:E3 ubiquitin-protein ligase APD2-like isoform X2 [Lotus japonicus]
MEEEEQCHDSQVSASSSLTATPLEYPSTSLFQAEEANREGANEGIQHNHLYNISVTNPSMTVSQDGVWYCIVVLVALWLSASVALAFGIYGSLNLQLGPYSSRLIEINSMLVQSVKVEQIDKPKPGAFLYGFDQPPLLDVKINWTEMYATSIPAKSQKEWIFYLNKDSQLDISYSVKSLVAPLGLVIAKGRESLVEWTQDPSFPNATLYWNTIYGSGSITQKISHSYTYYVAVSNMNPESVEVELNFIVNSFLYNTTNTSHRCSLDNGLCRLSFMYLESNTALLTTPGPGEGVSDEEWFDVKVSYEPRWIIYLTGSGVMAVLIFFAMRFCKVFQISSEERARFQQAEVLSERTPFLLPGKNNHYESFSNEEEDLTMWLEENSVEGKQVIKGETSNDLQFLCVICFETPRDCFFLPCGHCAACFACGTRIAAEVCTCPICRRKLKKSKENIFSVIYHSLYLWK